MDEELKKYLKYDFYSFISLIIHICSATFVFLTDNFWLSLLLIIIAFSAFGFFIYACARKYTMAFSLAFKKDTEEK